jgi:tRNA (guanine-N7-)-methyltransferase
MPGDGGGDGDVGSGVGKKPTWMKKQERTRSMPLSQKWYKNKQRHMSPNQKRVYNDLWPTYGIDLKYNVAIDPCNLMNIDGLNSEGNDDEVYTVLDIGFGTGDSITGLAQQHPERLYLGCEIHRASIAVMLQKAGEMGLGNVRVIRSDVGPFLSQNLVDKSINEVCIFFPDPWPNEERDGERRVVRASILDHLSQKLRPGGIIRIATDVEDYAKHVDSVFTYHGCLWKCLDKVVSQPTEMFKTRIRPITKYEKRALDLGHRVWDFVYQLQ